METLQNNFTTVEQSKRLLELGVPANSADFARFQDNEFPEILYSTYDEYMQKLVFTEPEEYTPCWSVGRLISLIKVCTGTYPDIKDLELPIIVFFMDLITACIKLNIFDFSKLEE